MYKIRILSGIGWGGGGGGGGGWVFYGYQHLWGWGGGGVIYFHCIFYVIFICEEFELI